MIDLKLKTELTIVGLKNVIRKFPYNEEGKTHKEVVNNIIHRNILDAISVLEAYLIINSESNGDIQ